MKFFSCLFFANQEIVSKIWIQLDYQARTQTLAKYFLGRNLYVWECAMKDKMLIAARCDARCCFLIATRFYVCMIHSVIDIIIFVTASCRFLLFCLFFSVGLAMGLAAALIQHCVRRAGRLRHTAAACSNSFIEIMSFCTGRGLLRRTFVRCVCVCVN